MKYILKFKKKILMCLCALILTFSLFLIGGVDIYAKHSVVLDNAVVAIENSETYTFILQRESTQRRYSVNFDFNNIDRNYNYNNGVSLSLFFDLNVIDYDFQIQPTCILRDVQLALHGELYTMFILRCYVYSSNVCTLVDVQLIYDYGSNMIYTGSVNAVYPGVEEEYIDMTDGFFSMLENYYLFLRIDMPVNSNSITEDEENAIYQEGWQVGYEEGVQFGESTGYEQGFVNGYNQGAADQYEQDMESISSAFHDGYSDGYSDGEELGYSDGYSDGEELGYSTGYEDGYNSATKLKPISDSTGISSIVFKHNNGVARTILPNDSVWNDIYSTRKNSQPYQNIGGFNFNYLDLDYTINLNTITFNLANPVPVNTLTVYLSGLDTITGNSTNTGLSLIEFNNTITNSKYSISIGSNYTNPTYFVSDVNANDVLINQVVFYTNEDKTLLTSTYLVMFQNSNELLNQFYQSGYDNGYLTGSLENDSNNLTEISNARTEGYNNGYDVGYNKGYNKGIEEITNDFGFFDLFTGIANAPITTLKGLFGFELFGIKLFNALSSILTIILVVWVIRKFIH